MYDTTNNIMLMTYRDGETIGVVSLGREQRFTVSVGMPLRKKILIRCLQCQNPAECGCHLPPIEDATEAGATRTAYWIYNAGMVLQLMDWDSD